jgi:hypothetical protein
MAAKLANQEGDDHRLSTNCSQTTAAVATSAISTLLTPDRRLENHNQNSAYTSLVDQNIQPPVEPEQNPQEVTVNEQDEFAKGLDSDEEPELSGAEPVRAEAVAPEQNRSYLGPGFSTLLGRNYCDRVKSLSTGNRLPIGERTPDEWRPGQDFELLARLRQRIEDREDRRYIKELKKVSRELEKSLRKSARCGRELR